MPKKLIEVALPLRDISEGSAAEKSMRSGQLSNLHPWWARRPLVAARAVLFAQLVDDPSEHPERFPSEGEVENERKRLFEIIRLLSDPAGPSMTALQLAKEEIQASLKGPVLLSDPFAGGGAIPLEAQRLGLKVDASDLNPVAVLLNRVVLELLPRIAGRRPVNPDDHQLFKSAGDGLAGFCADVTYYGKLLRELARKATVDLYPPILAEDGSEVDALAWIWVRTVDCPNPACQISTPLTKSFVLSKKKGREAWIDPVIVDNQVRYKIRKGKTPRLGETVGRTGAKCVSCGASIPLSTIRDQAQRVNLGVQLLAIVGLGQRQRVYFEATNEHEAIAQIETDDPFGTDLSFNPRDIKVPNYGMRTIASLFTPRQLTTLKALAKGIEEVVETVKHDSKGDSEYASAVGTILGLAVSKLSELSSALCPWEPSAECPRRLFGGQAIKMTWMFAEGNPLGNSSGSFLTVLEGITRTIQAQLVGFSRSGEGKAIQANAASRSWPDGVVISTDPPYFDNIAYADLSDFFYVWLRLSLQKIYPDLFQTLLTPKIEELVAIPFRFDGDQQRANEHFENGFREVFGKISEVHHKDIPMTIFYAYKQEDDEDSEEQGTASGAGATGWEKLLQGMVDTGLQITSTWPMRTEMKHKVLLRKANALASSVVLTCRLRDADAGITDRQGFIRHLRKELAKNLAELQSGGVQPVDLAQASIGPGMAVFTSYARVLDGRDRPMEVATALQIINQVLDEIQSDQETDFDVDTRWAVKWFSLNGMNASDFGDAQNNATAYGTAVNALERAGIIEARGGRVRLLSRSEYADDWNPTTDKRLTVWEVCQQLIRRVEGDGGLMAAAALLRQVGDLGEAARDLAYRLYEIANRNGWSEEARAYNNLAAEWPDLVALAAQSPSDPETLF